MASFVADNSLVVEKHVENLSKVCRVCGSTLACGNGYSYPVTEFKEKLTKTFGDIFNLEDREVNRPYFCSRCHASLGHTERGSVTTVKIAVWVSHTNNCNLCHMRSKGGRPKKVCKSGGGKKITSMSISDIKEWDGTKLLPVEVESAFQHYLAVKIIKSTLPCKSIQVDTGGPQKLTLAPITVA